METRAALAAALAMHRRRLAAVRDEQWHDATPCTEWDVRALANHVVGEVRWIPPLVAGKTIADLGDSLSGDLLGDTPLHAWDDATQAATASAAEEDAMQRTVHLSYGDSPASDYLDEVAADIVVHTWDLARATGGDEHLDAALVTFATATLLPRLDAWRSAGAVGPALDPGVGADDQARLLAATGRDPR